MTRVTTFAHRLNTLYGGRQTLQSFLDTLITQQGGAGWFHDYQELTGTLADNRRYTAAPSVIFTELFDAWTADNPDGWTVAGEVGSDPEVTQRASGELNAAGDGGLGSANYFASVTSNQPTTTRTVLTIGKTYTASVVISAIQISTVIRLRDPNDGFTSDNSITNVAGTYAVPRGIAASATLELRGRLSPVNATVDSLSVSLEGEKDAKLAGTFVLGQTGLQGANHAVDLNGSTALATIIDTSTNGLTAFTFIILCKPDVIGAGDRLAFKSGEFDLYLNADGSMTVNVDYATTDAATTSDAGVVTAGAWHLIAVTINNTDKLANIYVNGIIVNNTEQVGVGTRVTNTNGWLVGKNAGTDGLDGLVDFDLLDNVEWSEATILSLAQFAGLS